MSIPFDKMSVPFAEIPHHASECPGRKGSLQRTLAWDLHREAKVPFGPCSYDALTTFSKAVKPASKSQPQMTVMGLWKERSPKPLDY